MRKNKIRILHVAQAAGGVDRYIRMLLKYLDKEKFENILICSQDFHEEDYKGLVDYNLFFISSFSALINNTVSQQYSLNISKIPLIASIESLEL